MPRVLEYNATLTRREELADGLAVFHVELDEPLEPRAELDGPFRAGQYVTIGLNRSTDDPEDTRPPSVLRPMTIASAPSVPGVLEFYVRYIDKPDSRLPLTHLMWDLAPGGRIYVRPAVTGHFTEPDTLGDGSDRSALMIAGGTGLAPFLSILRERIARDPDARLDDRAVLYAVYNPEHLGYHDELEHLARERGLGYLPTVTRRHESSGWAGSVGKVADCLAEDRIRATEAALGLDLRPDLTTVLVCGLGPTIAATIRALLPLGFLPGHRRLRTLLDAKEAPTTLFYEQFDSAPLFDLKDAATREDLRARWRSGR